MKRRLPEPDRANPYLEFDPQMCIFCTRCVRACADIRTPGPSTLAGKGSTTAIAFGTGGPVHDSNCDFCGACIDVCPTATLMEKPNKWVALAKDWTNSACNSCSVGCTISYGVANDRPVIVRPDRLNQFSRDQTLCAPPLPLRRHPENQRLGRSLARRGDRLLPIPADEAITEAARLLDGVRSQHGGQSIAVLGSPLATNEEAYLLAKLARDVIGRRRSTSRTGSSTAPLPERSRMHSARSAAIRPHEHRDCGHHRRRSRRPRRVA